MRTIGIFILVFFINANCYSQVTTGPNDSLTQLLKGTWYVVNSWPAIKDTLVFKRKSNAPDNLGDRIEISETGEIVDAYSAPCGNDNRTHHTAGSWTVDKNGDIFTTTIPIYLDRTKNKILKLTADSLVLFKLD